MKKNLLILAAFATISSCQINHQEKEEASAVGSGGWLAGDTNEKFEEVAHQLGGFSKTMIEVSYRYSELYWAGMDENWQYADHQVEHLLEALEDGLKRRKERAASAESFLNEAIPSIEAVIKKEDKEEFLKGFRSLTSACNACHAKEGESFIMIKEPEVRTSPVRF
ncbi:hypothetical protein MM239_04595 [Belliella sp. DSM 111904]|uniref:Cytochrome c domain-containing protein n=1 Tax=Belliella filtrata TaxID=2923435 RepID=A0ABS9UWX7_9BACT|nr:hypothetical protein [Belliella filtrata]MCH7408663.1 hypothetical protein [Belliella filtrata]